MRLGRHAALVGGKDVEPPDGRYVHTVRASAVYGDTFDALRRKQELDEGRREPAADEDDVVGACALADASLVDEALASAAGAAARWAATPLADRVETGVRIGELIAQKKDLLVQALVAEGQPRSLAGAMLDEYVRADFSRETLEWCAARMHEESAAGGRRRIVRRVPDGVVCLNPPQNAATANALFGMAALVAGNAVVLRAPRSLPLATTLAAREVVAPALAEAGAPPGTLNVVCSSPTTDRWLASPHVDSVVYVGGSAKGLAFERAAVESGTKPILELAGNDGCLIWSDADVEGAVESLAENLRQSGQICNVPNHAIVHPAVADEVIARLSAIADATRPGPPEDPDVVLTPVLMAGAHFAHVADAVDGGAELVTGGRRLEVDGTESATGFFVEPTVLRVDGMARARRIAAVTEETFSPLMPIVVPSAGDDAEMLDEALRFLDGNAYGLRTSVWSRDPAVVDRALAGLTRCGVVVVNGPHSRFRPTLPTHGGTGLTGGAFGEANYIMLRTSRLQGVDLGGAR